MARQNQEAEILVFGYSCKLFRDDEKAAYIDHGKHLIPWMGDESNKIDRYDARGALYDLRHAEASSQGFTLFDGLTENEKRVEVMCDEERYRDLHTIPDDDEDLKRSDDTKYSEIQYDYSTKEAEPTVEEEANDADEQPFTPSPFLDIPLNMVLPKTVKQNAIIEKTAEFINKQGLQMEILLKMKQAGNPLFEFLAHDNALHGYYRLIVQIMKTGRYRPHTEVEEEPEDQGLHPSLLQSSAKVNLAPSIPTLSYKPSENCAYSMLVNKLKAKTAPVVTPVVEKQPEPEEDTEKASIIVKPALSEEPSPDVKLIIDKMAYYVAKNGRDFETTVKNGCDKRFQFLEPNHIHFGYYTAKVASYHKQAATEEETRPAPVPVAKITPPKPPVIRTEIASVSFSIKPKEADPIIEPKSFPCDDSSEEEENEKGPDPKKPKKEANNTKPVKPRESRPKNNIKPIIKRMPCKSEPEENLQKAEERLVEENITKEQPASKALAGKNVQLDRKKRLAEFLSSKCGISTSEAEEDSIKKSPDETKDDVDSFIEDIFEEPKKENNEKSSIQQDRKKRVAEFLSAMKLKNELSRSKPESEESSTKHKIKRHRHKNRSRDSKGGKSDADSDDSDSKSKKKRKKYHRKHSSRKKHKKHHHRSHTSDSSD